MYRFASSSLSGIAFDSLVGTMLYVTEGSGSRNLVTGLYDLTTWPISRTLILSLSAPRTKEETKRTSSKMHASMTTLLLDGKAPPG